MLCDKLGGGGGRGGGEVQDGEDIYIPMEYVDSC